MVVVTKGRVGAQSVGLIFGLLEGFFDDFWRGFVCLLLWWGLNFSIEVLLYM